LNQGKNIRGDLHKLAQETADSIYTMMGEVLDAVDDDLATMKAPDTAVLDKYPEFGRSIANMVESAEKALTQMRTGAEDARAEARKRGYV
jgi:hypothetical protein